VEGNEAGHVLVHFDGYEHKYDEWVPAQSHRIQGLARPASSPKLKTSSEKAKDEVAKEFSRYEQVAVSGQNAYKQDAAAAAAGTKWDNHKQYVRDEMRGDMEAQKTAARYSNIARLGTPEEVHAAKSTAPNTGKKDVSSKVPQLSVVQAAAQAAANAAASVVDEAKAAVAEVEGAPASQPAVSKERPQEQVRAKNGGARQGRGRLGDSTERTYAQVGRLLSLAGTSAKAEGNADVSKQVAQEQKTLAKLKGVPGKLPERVQHNLVSAGASLLRRLGIGAGAQHVPQSTPLTANDNNAVLAVASESEGPSRAKMRAMRHLHQLHARAHAHEKAVQQRLSEENTSEDGKTADDGAETESKHETIENKSEGGKTADDGAGAESQHEQSENMSADDKTADDGAEAANQHEQSDEGKRPKTAEHDEKSGDEIEVSPSEDKEEEQPTNEKEVNPSEDTEEEKPANEDQGMKPKDDPEQKPTEDEDRDNTNTKNDEAKTSDEDEEMKSKDDEEEKTSDEDEEMKSKNDEHEKRAEDEDDQKPVEENDGEKIYDKDEEETPADEKEEKPADVQPSVEVQPPLSPAEERRLRKEKWKREHQHNTPGGGCNAACQRRKRREEWEKKHQHGKAGPKEEHHYEGHYRDWQSRKISPVPSSPEYGEEDQVGAGAEVDGCWVPDLPETREALCTPSMYKDGTCEEVWGDVPEITGAVEAFALKRVHVPADSSKLHLEVVTAPFTQMPKENYGSITVGYQKRADGATWQFKSRTVASSSPWSTIGFFENAPDMLVKDCEGGFLGVISMDPLEGKAPAGHEAEAVARTGGVYQPALKLDQPIRAKILGNAGKESLTVIKGGLDVLGDDVGLVRYHLYTTDTRRLVCVMERREHVKNGGLDWVIRMEKGGPLDIRVAGVLAAQLEAETMHKVTNMKVVVLAIAFILLGLVLLCCLLPIVVRWCNEWRSRKREPTYVPQKRVEETELPHSAGPAAPSNRGPPAVSSRGDLSARSLATSYAPTATSRGMTARTDGADTVLSTGRDYTGGDLNRGDFWDRLPALDEPTPRGVDYYQAPAPRSSHAPSMAPLMQAASLRGLPDEETKVRALLAQHPGSGRPTTPRKGWEATSFRETQRSYREQGDMEIRDVLHNVLDPVVGGDTAHRPDSMGAAGGARRPKSLREWAEKYDFNLPGDDNQSGGR